MSNGVQNVAFIPDEQKVNLRVGDMIDRIINLKLTCVDQKHPTADKEVFVIRSDYELIFPDEDYPVDGVVDSSTQGKYIIRRCTNKPSIKVQTKMVSSNVGISTDIFVSNFFMLTHDGKHLRSFNNSEYLIEKVELVMGYWSQFCQMEADKETVPTYDEYFNLEAKNGADKLTLTGAIVVTTDKLPPDSTLHIKGYVADIYESPIAIATMGQDSMNKITKNPVASSGTKFEDVLFNNITRRYLSRIKAPTTRRNVAVSDLVKLGYSVNIKFDKETGMMDADVAKEYGVKVYLSDSVKNIQLPKMEDEDGKTVDRVLYFEAGFTIGQTIARIASFMNTELDFTFNTKGDLLVYSIEEANDPEKLYNAFNNDGMYKDNVFTNKKLYNNRLPAVYNINVDAVATITCPFFTFIEPFQYVEFASRYALTSLVGYFASYSPTVYQFLIINATISFATVDDVNEVQMTAVARKDSARI